MNVTLAKSAGFCFGVKRAVDMVYEQVEQKDEKPIYTYGPIIHNEEVVNELSEKGVIVLAEDQDISQVTPGTVIIRSHGVGRNVMESLENEKICIVSQTTFNYNKFQELVEIIRKKGYDILVLNTICNATEERQSEAATIAHAVDAMIVIGGKHSSNTQKLFEICKKECEDTYYIQTKEDLDLSVLQSISNVGITAGASTPNKIIEEVQKICQK